MVGSSKILTVSYGTFSCTLEGFDDSFSTMKAIAEYFRDLASDDRYFGAEPPTPDAEMLARIAEREVSRRVEARTNGTGITLRAGSSLGLADGTTQDREKTTDRRDADAATPAGSDEPAMPPAAEAPAETPSAPAPRPSLPRVERVTPPAADRRDEASHDDDDAAHPDADSVAAKLQRIRAVVGRGAALPATSYEEDDGGAGPAPTAAPDTMEDVVADAGKRLATEIAKRADADIADADADTDTDAPAPMTAETAEAPVSSTGDNADDTPAAKAGPDAKPEPESGDSPIRARVIRMRRSDFEQASAAQAAPATPEPAVQTTDDTDLALADTAPDAEDAADMSWLDAAPAALDRTGSTLSDEEEDALQAELAALSDEDGAADPAETANALETAATDDAPTDTAEAHDEGDGDTADETDAEGDVADRSDASQSDDPAENEPELDDDTRLAGTRIMPRRVSLPEPEETEATEASDADPDDATAAQVETGDTDDTDDTDEDEDADRAAAQRRDRLLETPDEDEAAMARILSQAEAEHADPEARGRREALSQLKAAVAATEAARSLGDGTDEDDETENAFRDDLRRVVQPRRATLAEHRTERPRPAPLKLVASQRIDLPGDGRAANDEPVQPRRVSSATPATAPVHEGRSTFAEFAAEMGAEGLAETMEAAAAYIAFVEQEEDFSRPQLMSRVRETTDEQFTREEGLRSFGTLLRQGRIAKVRNGRFQVAGDTRYNPERRAG